jgi:hypothetical protein
MSDIHRSSHPVNTDPSKEQYDAMTDWLLTKMPQYFAMKSALMSYVQDVLCEMDARYPGSGPNGATTPEERLFRKQVRRGCHVIYVPTLIMSFEGVAHSHGLPRPSPLDLCSLSALLTTSAVLIHCQHTSI